MRLPAKETAADHAGAGTSKLGCSINMDELANLGQLAASRQVKAEHFPAAFDLG
jgi:hypothetical protein